MTLEKRKEKEQKELTRLRKINQKPQTAKYIKWIFVLVSNGLQGATSGIKKQVV